MKIYTSSIEGIGLRKDSTLMVSCFEDYGIKTPTEDIPDEWVCQLKNNRPCVGNEFGSRHLTRLGYLNLKDRIKIDFDNSGRNESLSWEMFNDLVYDEHFAIVEEGKEKLIKQLEKKLEQAKNFTL